MCLLNNQVLVEKFLKENKGSIVQYKILMLRDGKLVSPAYSLCKWKPGYFRMDEKYSKEQLKISRTRNAIHEGIHVNRTKNAAKNLCESWGCYSHIIVPVTCYVKDLIGI